MAAMGLLAVPPAHARAPELARNSGRGTRVIILGAGIAGMTAAYELGKAGYDCVILEARARAGGRNWTVRGGDRVEEIDSVQTVGWARAENLFFNVGPARLPHHHKTVLGYCKEFGIPLQLIVNDNPNAFLHDETSFDGKPVRMRQVRNDIRGELAELLAKAVDSGALDATVTGDDKEMLIAFVRHFGSLQKDLAYRGSSKAGWTEPPGAGLDAGKLNEPLALRTLMQNAFWGDGELWRRVRAIWRNAAADRRHGPNCRILCVAAAARIRFNAEVKQIRRSGERGARVVYHDRVDGTEIALEAPIVLVTIPLSVLKDVDADFSPGHKAAIAAGAAGYVPSAKIAFEARRRFWEEDEQMYGGISWTTQDITQIWYPSTDFHGRTGIILGAYIWTSKIAEALAKLTPAERLGLRAGARRKASSDLPRRRRQRCGGVVGQGAVQPRRLVRVERGREEKCLSGAARSRWSVPVGGRAPEQSAGLAGRGDALSLQGDRGDRRASGGAAQLRRTYSTSSTFSGSAPNAFCASAASMN